MRIATSKPHTVEQIERRVTVPSRPRDHRQQYVLEGGELREKVVGLENETNALTAVSGGGRERQSGNASTSYDDLSGIGPVEAGD